MAWQRLRRFAWVIAWFMGVAAMAGMPAWAASRCDEPTGLPSAWPSQRHAGQVLVQGGAFVQGSNDGYAEERPPRPVTVSTFWMDRTEVSNAQFAAFVKATGHVTDAERAGGSAVFAIPSAAELRARPMAWWRFVQGANWRHPQGPASSLKGKQAFPVVHLTQADALAYARWLGHDLPTEAEWEYAAKAGRQGPELDVAPRTARGKPDANYWQGNFPLVDTAEDGHAGTAPVACYAPNAWGLYDMVGNVWEWTLDVQRGAVQGGAQGHANGDPSLLKVGAGFGAKAREATAQRLVIKGGSYLCSPDYCVRYRASARESQEADVPSGHVGFRTVSRVTPLH